MLTPFALLSLSAEELLEMHRALLARLLMDSTLRREHGFEPVEPSPLLLRLEQLLAMDEKTTDLATKRVDEELWEHAWLAFTDEWAWSRAHQDVCHKMGKSAMRTMPPHDLESLVRKRYEERFDHYLQELNMEAPKTRAKHHRLQKKNPRNP